MIFQHKKCLIAFYSCEIYSHQVTKLPIIISSLRKCHFLFSQLQVTFCEINISSNLLVWFNWSSILFYCRFSWPLVITCYYTNFYFSRIMLPKLMTLKSKVRVKSAIKIIILTILNHVLPKQESRTSS